MLNRSLDFYTKVDISVGFLSHDGDYDLSMASGYVTRDGENSFRLVTKDTHELQAALSELIAFAYRLMLYEEDSSDGMEIDVPDYMDQLQNLLVALNKKGLLDKIRISLIWGNLVQLYSELSSPISMDCVTYLTVSKKR